MGGTVLDKLDTAMELVVSGRAGMGARQNRLESSIRVNMNQVENLSAANSRIRDVDVASEMSELTRRLSENLFFPDIISSSSF